MDADLVVLGSDPSNDVRAFVDVVEVVRGGLFIYEHVPSGR